MLRREPGGALFRTNGELVRERVAWQWSFNRRRIQPAVPFAFLGRVVSVESFAVPGREFHPAESPIGNLGAHQSPGSVVVHQRRDADFFVRITLSPTRRLR